MCGIGVVLDLDLRPVPHLRSALSGMTELLAHRGPDGEGVWAHEHRHVGFAHRRLSIIGLERGNQPMSDGGGNWITYNGEIYNYIELRDELGAEGFVTDSDTEVILNAYRRWGEGCLDRLRGMFAFALWDEREQRLLVARDRFGIKPLYYALVDGILYCASEVKALLPFLPTVETDRDGLRDYLAFQFPLDAKTLFKGVKEVPAGHTLVVQHGNLRLRRWWEVEYVPDLDHTDHYFSERLRHLIADSVRVHLRADVPVGAYLSGGLDSSIVTTLAARTQTEPLAAFTGRFDGGERYDESVHARAVADAAGADLNEVCIGPADFIDDIRDVIYHLDYPTAGPGSFPQYVVSRLASRHRKVVLGGQGGDEVFGGYTRYLIAYFEQCIKAAIEGTMHRAEFVVTYESIIPNLETLREYRPLIQEFWREGVFGNLDERYFRLVNRAPGLHGAIDWEMFDDYSPLETFLAIFRAENVGRESYFDRMTHFDFKTLLPALLQVEDRVSMAHGLESRTPLVDHEVVEFAATLPALYKFKGGELKRALKLALGDVLPQSVAARRDKMGFPVPLTEWLQDDIREFVIETLNQGRGRREYLAPGFDPGTAVLAERGFSRNVWGLLSLELWHQSYHDRAEHWRELRERFTAPDSTPLVRAGR